MATPQAITALVRASRPEFKSTADKVFFAVHAIISVNGFSLRKVGEGADDAALQGAAALPRDEVDIAGWNNEADVDGGTYSFLYVPEPGAQRQDQPQQPQAPPLLLLKGLRLAADTPPAQGPKDLGAAAAPEADGGVLLVSLADVVSGRPPASIELRLDRYAPALVPGAAGYEHLEELIRRVQDTLAEALEGRAVTKSQAATGRVGAGTATSAGGGAAAKGEGGGGNQQKRERDHEAEELARLRRLQEEEEERRRRDPLRDDRYPPGGTARVPPGWGPAGVGDEDLMPGGLPRPPGMGGLGGPGGLGGVPMGPRGLGGGMHVGPENPIFSDRLRHPRGGPGFPPGVGGGGGGAVPGMRWDPIAPEGLQGWSPDDFTQAGRFQHGEGFNDIGRPPPGRGPDWDNMFG